MPREAGQADEQRQMHGDEEHQPHRLDRHPERPHLHGHEHRERKEHRPGEAADGLHAGMGESEHAARSLLARGRQPPPSTVILV